VSYLRHSKVLTIAHRLHTIVDSDRILVLEAGKLLEYDAPQQLLRCEILPLCTHWSCKDE